MQYKKAIALYIRLSIEDKDVKKNDSKTESDSIEHQRKLLKDYINSKDELKEKEILEYKDDGYTGTDFNRPRYIEMMSDVRNGKIDIIIVKDFSRLGRDYLESGKFLDKIFPAYGVRFIAVNDGYDSKNHTGQTAGIDVGLKNLINEMYSKDISIKNKSARRTRERRGEHISGYVFYGYKKSLEDKHKIVIDEEAANIVKRIFEYCCEGLSTYKIAKILNNENIPSPYEYKKMHDMKLNVPVVNDKVLWISSKIRVILRDERYTGKMINHKTESDRVGRKRSVPVPKEEWIVVENTHEPIISEETFKKAGLEMDKRSKRSGIKGKLKKRKNLFTCSYCKHKLQFSGGSDNKKYLYCCEANSNNNEKCKKIHFEVDDIKCATVDSLNIIGSVYTDVMKKRNFEESNIESYKKNIKKCEQQISALKVRRRDEYMRMRDGKIRREEYAKRMEESSEIIKTLDEEIKKNNSSIEEIKKEKNVKENLMKQVDEVFMLDEFDEEKLNIILDAIFVDEDGKIELSFKSQDILKDLNIFPS